MTKKEILIMMMRAYLGVPYIFGGSSPQGIDCSGLVLELLKAVGVYPSKGDNTAAGLANYYKAANMKMNIEFGDLLFFGKSSSEISHVAFAVSADQMFESGGGDASTTTVLEALKREARVRIRPIKSRSDLVLVATPPYNFERTAA